MNIYFHITGFYECGNLINIGLKLLNKRSIKDLKIKSLKNLKIYVIHDEKALSR